MEFNGKVVSSCCLWVSAVVKRPLCAVLVRNIFKMLQIISMWIMVETCLVPYLVHHHEACAVTKLVSCKEQFLGWRGLADHINIHCPKSIRRWQSLTPSIFKKGQQCSSMFRDAKMKENQKWK